MKLALLFISLITCSTLFSQAPSVVWENSIGGLTDDYGYFLEATADGGYIVVGSSTSADADMPGNFGSYDVLLTKLDNAGAIVWTKNIGGSDLEEAYNVHQTVDGGYVITGYTKSNDIHIGSNYGLKDVWVVKTNALGVIQWENTYGGTNDERAYSTQQTADGGYIMTGYTISSDNDVTFNNGNADVWIVKIDSSGTLMWQKSLGGTGSEFGNHIGQTSDGGYIVTAYTNSNDGDISGYQGGDDVWIIKINSVGTIQWESCYGGTSFEYGTAAYPTVDGGYIFSAYTYSNDGDVNSSHGDLETWLVKLSGTGAIQRQKCFGGSASDANYSFIKTLDNKYVIAGYTYSSDGDVVGQHGGGEADYWLIKTDTAGTLEWQKCVGGTGDDQAFSIIQNADSSFVLTGLSKSTDGDITGNAGEYDCWVVKLAVTVFTDMSDHTASDKTVEVVVYPNPSTGLFCFKNISANSHLAIYDITGKCISETDVADPPYMVDFSKKAKGLYFYRMTRSDGNAVCGKISVK